MPLIAVCHLAATVSRCPREVIWQSKDKEDNSSNSHLRETSGLLLRRLRALAPDSPLARRLTHLRARSPLEVEVMHHQRIKQMLR